MYHYKEKKDKNLKCFTGGEIAFFKTKFYKRQKHESIKEEVEREY